MEPRRTILWAARAIWLGAVVSVVACCIMALVLATHRGGPVAEWAGTAGAAPPVQASRLLPVCAILVPLLIALLRVLVVGPAAREPDAFAPRPQDQEAALQRWMGRQVAFFVLADLLPVLALVYVILWGMMPLLWLVAADCVLMMAFYFPRLPAGLSEQR